MPQKRILITGATGMVGGLALRFALDSQDVSAVTVIGRRPVDLTHPRLTQVRHSDFGNYAAVGDALANQDVALFCLGAYTSSVSDAELRRVTVDYTSAFAEALHARSPGAVVCFLSGYPVARRIYPNIGIASDDLARAMVHTGVHGLAGQGDVVLEHHTIRALAAEARLPV
jgi:uncharacterized protein YbjT (DUF2867 family)